jgi:hypothetical protein
VICDDFADDSYIPETWQASVSTVASLGSNVKWANLGAAEQQDYNEAAYLATQLMANSGNALEADAIQYALWQVFYPTGTASVPGVQPFLTAAGLTGFDTDSTDVYGVQYWLNMAASQKNTVFANVLVYTYDPSANPNGPVCGTGSCPTAPPQEFLVVTPEPSTILLLAMGMGGLFLLKKRQRSTARVLAA